MTMRHEHRLNGFVEKFSLMDSESFDKYAKIADGVDAMRGTMKLKL